jgi:hypothetical protein
MCTAVWSQNLKGRTELEDLGADWLIESDVLEVTFSWPFQLLSGYLRRVVW